MSVVITGKTNKELLEMRTKILNQAKLFVSAHDHSWNPQKEREYNEMISNAEEINEALAKREQLGGKISTSMLGDPMESPSRSTSGQQSRGKAGTTINGATFLESGQSAVDTLGFVGVKNAFGHAVRAMIVGDSSTVPPEIRSALNTSYGPSGGFAVPSTVSSEIIDMLRAKVALVRAGASTMIMPTSEVTLCKLIEDAQFETKLENLAFAETPMAFQARVLRSFIMGTILTASRELVEDATNFASQLEAFLLRSMAVQLDKLPLVGTPGTTAPFRVGLLNDDTIPHEESVGALSWNDVTNSVTTLRNANFEPTGIIMNPTNRDALLNTRADGSTGAWLGVPPSMTGIPMFDTTSVPATQSITGDFRRLIIGVRGGPFVEVSNQAEEAFARHQVKLKIGWRGDYHVTDDNAFHVLRGIS